MFSKDRDKQDANVKTLHADTQPTPLNKRRRRRDRRVGRIGRRGYNGEGGTMERGVPSSIINISLSFPTPELTLVHPETTTHSSLNKPPSHIVMSIST